MKNMGKEIVAGIVFIGGVALAVVAAEVSAPILAGVGALAALGAGVYEASSAPKSSKKDYTSARRAS